MRRELNEFEYMNWSLGQPYNMVNVIHIRGNISHELLVYGFKMMQIRHPLLQTQIFVDGTGFPYLSSENIGPVPVKEIPRIHNSQVHEIMEQELQYIFPMGHGVVDPLFRVHLLKGKDDMDLIFTAQHVIADGLSMVFLLRDLFNVMLLPPPELKSSGNAPQVLADAVQHEWIIPEKYRQKIPKTPRKFRIMFRFIQIAHAIKFGLHKSSPHMVKTPSNPRPTLILSHQFTKDQTERLISLCKNNRVSVHSAICTVMVSAFPIINNPVNMRERLAKPVGEAVGMFAGGGIVRMKYHKSQPFWYNAQLYQHKLRTATTDAKVYGIFTIIAKSVPLVDIQRFGPLFVDLASNNRAFAVTNLGSLDKIGIPLDTDQYHIEEFNGGVSGTIEAISLVVFTIRGSLHFHLNYKESMIITSDAQQIMQNAVKSLSDVIANN